MPRRRSIQVAALALLTGWAGSAAAQPSTTHVARVGDAIVFEGRINQAAAAQFLQLLQDPAITRLVITSNGGMVSAALDMAEALHARQLDLEVPTACLSSCANYLFPAARRKTLGWPGAVAWHGNITHVLHLQQTGQASWDAQAIQSARQLARREKAFFRRLGVDGFVCWFAKIAPYEVPDFYYLSPPDMERFGIREVRAPAASPGGEERADLRHVRVDWSRLEAGRPLVRLDE